VDTRITLSRLTTFCLLIALCIPLATTSAQSDEDGSDFIITLALMAVADNRMDNVLTTPDLANIRDMVDEYFANLPYRQMSSEFEYRVRTTRDALVNTLDAKIAFQKTFDARVNTAFFKAVKDGYDTFRKDPNPLDSASEYILMDTLSAAGEFKPDIVFLDMLNGILERDYENTLEKDLDGHVAETVEGGDQFIAQSSDSVYDFSAGLSKEEYRDQLSQLKPVVFINNGSRDVTVSIEYYAPPKDMPLSAPGLNMTVKGGQSVTPGPLPQGNYTFCAHWETDMDTDGDGLKDFDRMVTHTWLSSGHSDDPAGAEEVYVNSVGTATPIGRCDGFKGEAPQSEAVMTENFMTEADNSPMEEKAVEPVNPEPNADFWDQEEEEGDGEEPAPTEEVIPTTEAIVPTEVVIPTEPGLSLTSAELANQGTHSYLMTCQFGEDTESSSFTATWEFSESGATYLEQGLFYSRVSPNVYQTDYPTIVTFTIGGYTTSSHYFETNEDGQEVKYPIQCTSTFQ
jgi:hypothetical protein